MENEKLIERLRTESLYADKASLEIMDLCMEAATALSTLQAENEKLRAELEQVRHGSWERNSPDDIVVYCSQCMMPQDAPSNYCPSCGARMDKEAEHEAD